MYHLTQSLTVGDFRLSLLVHTQALEEEGRLRAVSEESLGSLTAADAELNGLEARLEETRSLLYRREEAATAARAKVEFETATMVRSAVRVMYCHARAKGIEAGKPWHLGVFPHDGCLYMGSGPGFLPLSLPPEGQEFTGLAPASPEQGQAEP